MRWKGWRIHLATGHRSTGLGSSSETWIENPPFIDDVPIKTSILFAVFPATFDYWRVMEGIYIYILYHL